MITKSIRIVNYFDIQEIVLNFVHNNGEILLTTQPKPIKSHLIAFPVGYQTSYPSNILGDALRAIIEVNGSELRNEFTDEATTYVFEYTDTINNYYYQIVLNNERVIVENYLVNGCVEYTGSGLKPELPGTVFEYFNEIKVEEMGSTREWYDDVFEETMHYLTTSDEYKGRFTSLVRQLQISSGVNVINNKLNVFDSSLNSYVDINSCDNNTKNTLALLGYMLLSQNQLNSNLTIIIDFHGVLNYYKRAFVELFGNLSSSGNNSQLLILDNDCDDYDSDDMVLIYENLELDNSFSYSTKSTVNAI